MTQNGRGLSSFSSSQVPCESVDTNAVSVRATSFCFEHPHISTIIVCVLAALLSCYPVVFLGRSFVSPNNAGAPLVYDKPPFLPGSKDTLVENLRNSDTAAMMWQYMPYSVIEQRALFKDHEIPFWNRYNSAGVPLIGQGVSMMGDPLHFIPVLAGGTAWAWDVKFVIAKALFAAGVGLLVFAATGFVPAAIVIGASSPFIGFFALRFNHPAFFAVCYAPWILLCWLKILLTQTRGRRYAWVLALMFASWAQLNTGTVKESFALLTFLHLTGFIAFLMHDAPAKEKRELASLAGVCAPAFVLASAPAWLTFFSTLQTSYTLSDAPSAMTIFPGFLIGFFDEIFYAQILRKEWLFYPSTNFLILLGAVWSGVALRRLWPQSTFRAFVIGAAIAFAFAFGLIPRRVILATPLLRNLSHVGNVLSCVLLIHVLVLAGYGVKEFWQLCYAVDWRRSYRIGSFAIAAGVTIFYLCAVGQGLRLFITGVSGALSLLLFCAALMLPWGAKRLIVSRGRNAVAVILVAACLLVIHGRHGMHLETGWTALDHYFANPRPRPDFSVPSPAISTLKQIMTEPCRVLGINATLFEGFTGTLGIEGVNGPDPLMNTYYRELLDMLGFKRNWGWCALIMDRDLPAVDPALDLLNVRYLVAPVETPNLPTSTKLVIRHDLDVLERPTAWPRAFFCDTVIFYKTVQDFAGLVRDSGGKPFAAVRPEELPKVLPVRISAGLKTERIVVAAHSYRLSFNETSLVVQAPGPGIVVLTEAFVRDEFQVMVSGRPADYFRVNHAFKGVTVREPGIYRITFAYRPQHWGLSVWLACGGLVILAGVIPYQLGFLQ